VQPEAVFRAAGLDMAAFTEVPPSFVPVTASDQLRSWKGPHPKIPGLNLTVDMASWKGRVTQAAVRFNWGKGSAAAPAPDSLASRMRGIVLLGLGVLGFLAAVLLARRNWQLGRIDRKGALRIGIARCLLGLVVWVGTVHAVPDESMIVFFFANCAAWLMWGASLALIYVALEPSVRARWPHSIVTWNRLLAGRWLDAQVGAHILIGAAVGSAVWVAAEWIGDWQSDALGTLSGLHAALGTRQWLAANADEVAGALFFGLLVFFAICGLRAIVRKNIPAAILAALLLSVADSSLLTSPDWKIELAIYVGMYTALVFVLLRFGLVATIAAVFFLDTTNRITLGTDWKTWYAPSGVATLVLLLSVAVFAFWRSQGRASSA
jgi:serine/threonine-protein kinase